LRGGRDDSIDLKDLDLFYSGHETVAIGFSFATIVIVTETEHYFNKSIFQSDGILIRIDTFTARKEKGSKTNVMRFGSGSEVLDIVIWDI